MTQAEQPLQAFVSSAINGLEQERAAAADACDRLGVRAWVFEDTPASSDGLTDSYLAYVRESEWLIWLVQETTPEAVRAEVQEALDHGVRVLAFVLTDHRDQATSDLLASADVKWVKTTSAALGEVVEKSLRDEQRRQLRRRSVTAAAEPPPPPPDFTGRVHQLEELQASLAQPGAVVVLNGSPGVGKSALAHAVVKNNDGRQVLWVDFLSGEAEPRTILARLLTALDLPPRAGADVAELEHAWTQASRDTPVLLVIDDARTEGAVRPLLPSGAHSAALLTARTALPGLEGARHMHLDVFETEEAIGFLEAVLSADRIKAEHAAADELVALCGQLPLALRISAGRLATRHDLPVAEYAERLREERTRLSELSAGDLDVRTSFNVSYALLSDEEAQVFRALGWFGGPTIHADAVSAAAQGDAGTLLERLADAQLITGAGGSRYEMHDLLRVFAGERLREEDLAVRRDAGASLGAYYAAEAVRRVEQLHGSSSDEDDLRPVQWLYVELRNLGMLATGLREEELWEEVVELTFKPEELYAAAAAWDEWGDMLDVGMAAAQQLGDESAQRKFLLNTGIVAAGTGEHELADQRYREAQRLAEEAGDSAVLARVLAQRGTLAKGLGNTEEALALTGQARGTYKQDGDLHGEAKASGDYANQLDDLGRHTEAADAHRDALQVFEELGDTVGQAFEIGNLGIALGRAGQNHAAAAEFRRSLGLFEALGARSRQLDTQKRLAEALLHANESGEAIAVLDDGVALAEAIGDENELALIREMRAFAYSVLKDSQSRRPGAMVRTALRRRHAKRDKS